MIKAILIFVIFIASLLVITVILLYENLSDIGKQEAMQQKCACLVKEKEIDISRFGIGAE